MIKAPKAKFLLIVISVLVILVGIVAGFAVNANVNQAQANAKSNNASGKDCSTSLPRVELKSENGNITAMTTLSGEKYLNFVNLSNNQSFRIASYKQDFEHKHWRWPVDGCSVYKAYYNYSGIPAGNYRVQMINYLNQQIGDTLTVNLNPTGQNYYNNQFSTPSVNVAPYIPQYQYSQPKQPISAISNYIIPQDVYINTQPYKDVQLGYYSNVDDVTLVNTPGVDTKSLQDLSNLLKRWRSTGYSNCYNNDWSVGSCNYMQYLRSNGIIFNNSSGYWTLSHKFLYDNISKLEKLMY